MINLKEPIFTIEFNSTIPAIYKNIINADPKPPQPQPPAPDTGNEIEERSLKLHSLYAGPKEPAGNAGNEVEEKSTKK